MILQSQPLELGFSFINPNNNYSDVVSNINLFSLNVINMFTPKETLINKKYLYLDLVTDTYYFKIPVIAKVKINMLVRSNSANELYLGSINRTEGERFISPFTKFNIATSDTQVSINNEFILLENDSLALFFKNSDNIVINSSFNHFFDFQIVVQPLNFVRSLFHRIEY